MEEGRVGRLRRGVRSQGGRQERDLHQPHEPGPRLVTKGRAEDSTSLAVQEEVCRKWCADNGYAVAGVYSDPDTSGSKVPTDQRPGWRAMAATEFDCVVVFKFDRLARDEADSAVTRGVLAAQGKRLVSATEGEDRLTAGILSVVAASFSRQHAERTSLSRSRNIRSGRAVGGKPPFGWRAVPIDPEKPKLGMVLAQDPDALPWVREMVARTQAGHTVYSTARWLTAQGVRPPTQRSATWRHSTVEQILRHPILAGMTPFNPRAGGQTRTRGEGVLRGDDGLPVVRGTWPSCRSRSGARWWRPSTGGRRRRRGGATSASPRRAS